MGTNEESIVLVKFFDQFDTRYGHLRRGSLYLGNSSIGLVCKQVCGGYFLD